MATAAADRPTLHALLVGIDAYRKRPLGGCVHDIDAIEHRLRTRLGATQLDIRRLSSPDLASGATSADPPATLANLRQALHDLGTARVAPHDRVFIYYSGHGSRVEVTAPNGLLLLREALVPVDHETASGTHQVLFDYELNERLRAIVARTRSVSLVLDCCHSSGVTRTGLEQHVDRCLELSLPAGAPPAPDLAGTPSGHELGDVEHCHVVAACFDHQRAREQPSDDGVRRGLLTSAFIAALDALPETDLGRTKWNQVWPAICAHVIERNPWQHPRILGHAGRLVFAGPPVHSDPGIPVSAIGDRYRIGAGELTSVTELARIAVYAETTEQFPPIDSPADHNSRLGVLHVTRAESAWAEAIAEREPFPLPDGARARLIGTGVAARLRFRVEPSDPELEAQLARSRLLRPASPSAAPLVTLQRDRGLWFLTDDLHDARADRPVLCCLRPAELESARRVLEHYHRYWQPLRLADLANDLDNPLELAVLQCPRDRVIRAAEAQEGDFPPLFTRHRDTYVVSPDVRLCFRTHNRSPERLRVTLLNAAASGKVQLLGEEVIEAGAARTFWAGSTLGAPFTMVAPRGATTCIDRVVAIGRSNLEHELGHLRTETTFADAFRVVRGHPGSARSGDRPFGDDAPLTRDGPHAPPPPLERWTSAQAVIETRAR
jgi:hypothetical protein